MNYSSLKQMSDVALGRKKASLVLKNSNVINVFTEEILLRDIAIENGMIAGIGNYSGHEEIDLKGNYVCPGFIDAHLHFESTLVTPPELIQAAMKWGTTTFIVDPHEIVNVAGEDGIDYILDQTNGIDGNVYIMLPSCVPATNLEENGGVFLAENMKAYINHPRVLGLGEVMDYTAVIEADSEMVKKLDLFKNKPKDGHAPFLQDKQLSAYALAKIKTDHECIDYEYALEEIRNGMQVLIREGSGARNLEAIVTGIIKNNMNTSYFSFCTDDKHIDDIQREGHISYNIKKSISLGINPIKAIKMATLNTAICYNLTELGAVAPGYQADLVVLNSLDEMDIDSVFFKGIKQSFAEKPIIKPCPDHIRNSIHVSPINISNIQLPINHEVTSVIQMVEGQITTKHIKMKVPTKNGFFEPNNTCNKVLVVERHKATGHYGIAPVYGFNLHNGAIAISVSHDSHNLIVIGDNDESIMIALEEILRVQGGYTIVRGNTVLETLPLPIAGLMSDAGHETIEHTLSRMIQYAHEMGVPQNTDPFISLSFLALPVIPEIRITTKGLYDVMEQQIID